MKLKWNYLCGRLFNKLVLLFLTLSLLVGCQFNKPKRILLNIEAGSQAKLAAKELKRYIYVTTGENYEIVKSRKENTEPNDILLIVNGQDADQDYVVKTDQLAKTITIEGGSEMAVLYGAYRLIEKFGVRFHIHGDVIPDQKVAFHLPEVDIKGSPKFELRGIQPFHDFPEGPDWWSIEDYKAIVAQLPKMGMNFVGFHTYPEKVFGGWEKAEVMTWIGTPDQVDEQGVVSGAYPALHSHTLDSTWDYHPTPTSEFICGADQLFDADNYGAAYMKGISPWPHTDEENIALFNQFGGWQKNIFSFANDLGVKTCLGTETPLKIPAKVQQHLMKLGLDPNSDKARELVYQGIFSRIQKLHPLNYYWFWTPETWTWEGENRDEVDRTINDLLIARKAAAAVGSSFDFATCGWVLGPSFDRSYFDQILPKDMPFSCINREVGFTPVEPSFAQLQGRGKWQISWVEDDPNMITPQLWAGRIRKDAADAYKYGCTGLMGIHWRTKILSPAFDALAQAGWDMRDWNIPVADSVRDLPVVDLYTDWVASEFGGQFTRELADIFANLDGGPLYVPGKNERIGKLLRTADWAGKGPGGIKVVSQPWTEIREHYRFVDKMEALAKSIQGEGNRDRFNYWLNTFRYAREMAHVACQLGEMETLVNKIKAEEDAALQVEWIEKGILPLRASLAESWNKMVTLLLQSVETTGELGTIANLEMHNLRSLALLTQYDSLLTSRYGKELPEYAFQTSYSGTDRLIVPAKRTLLESNEKFNLSVMVLSKSKVEKVVLRYRELGGKKFETTSFNHVNRNVFEIVIDPSILKSDYFEYYVEAFNNSGRLVWPVTAPELNQSVVIN